MNLAKTIRQNRLRAGLTQERLAEKLGVSPQAVSKWESAATLPDITLLPELSALLGVTIDALFDTSEETRLKRIETMLEKDSMLSRADFDYAVSQLEDLRSQSAYRAQSLTLLADLCLHRSQGYADRAAAYAIEALEEAPECKDNHSLLNNARGLAMGDWCATNHSRRIEFYKRFVQDHPGYLSGYLWLMDCLIADGRLSEARDALERMGKVEQTYHTPLYAGWIAFYAGDHAEAERQWDEMTLRYGDQWVVWSSRADTYAKQALYPQAIAAYERAAALQAPPRYTDNAQSIAQICEILGDRAGAIRAYEQVVEILRADWGITEGETLEGYLQNIRALKEE